MAFQFLAGEHFNHLSRALQVTPNPAADSAFPVGGLSDGRANIPFRFSAEQADSTIQVDLSAIPDPSFEAGVAGWVADGGTLTQDGAQHYSGTYSAKLTSTGVAQYYYEFDAVPGETRRLSWALFGSGAAAAAIVWIYNPRTKKYLQANGTWGAFFAALGTQTAAAWATGGLTYTVEPFSSTLEVTTRLRVYLRLSAAGTVYFDDIVDVPGVSWASIHGHDLTPAVVPTIQYSDGPSPWATAVTPTLRRRACYGTFAVQYYRYWRLLLSGGAPLLSTPAPPGPYIGEFVLGQYGSLLTPPDYPLTIEVDEAQVRSSTPQGAEHVYSRGGAERYRLTMPFVWTSDAKYQQARDQIYIVSRGGKHPLVVVPTETDPDLCILGRGRATLTPARTAYNRREGEIEVLEDPLPLMA
jgi:hypothetical protein